MKGIVYWKPTDEQCKKCLEACLERSTPACVYMDADYYGEGKCVNMTHFDTNNWKLLEKHFHDA